MSLVGTVIGCGGGTLSEEEAKAWEERGRVSRYLVSGEAVPMERTVRSGYPTVELPIWGGIISISVTIASCD